DDRPQRAGLDAGCRPTRERLGREHAVAYDPHVTGLPLDGLVAAARFPRGNRELGDQELTVWRERDVARTPEPFGDRDEAHTEQLARRAPTLRLAVPRATAPHPPV